MSKVMKLAYGLGVVFLMTGMLLSAVSMPAMAQEETPAAPTEEATEEVVATEEVAATEPVDLSLEGPAETEEPTQEVTEEPTVEATEEPAVEATEEIVPTEEAAAPELAAGFITTGMPETYEIQFTDISTGAVVAWAWSFGDGSAESSEQNPAHVYENAGEYNVSLTVSSADGATSTAASLVAFEEMAAPGSETEEETAEMAVEVIELLNEEDKTLVNEQGEVISAASVEFSEAISGGDPFFWNGTQWVGYATSSDGCPANVTCNVSATPFKDAVENAPENATIYVAQGHYNETVTITTNNLNFVGFSFIDVLTDGSGYINASTFYSGYATVDKIILNALFGATSGVYAEEVVVASGGRLVDGLELVDEASDGEVTANVQLVSNGEGYYEIRDANDINSTFVWECGEPDEVIYPGTTYTMVFKTPFDSEILNYYEEEENDDKRGLGLSAEARLNDFIIGINTIADLQAASGYTWTGEQEKQFFWYLLGNNNYNSLTSGMKTLADQILAGAHDGVTRDHTVWFLWPTAQGTTIVSPTNVQLTTINFGTPIVYGCTDEDSDNYNQNANKDDGSCMTYCEWDNSLPTGHPDCHPNLTLEATACEINANGGGTHYTWNVNISNTAAHDVPFTWESTGSGESGSGTVLASGGATFNTDKLTTTSVTITWWDGEQSVTEQAPVEMLCPADMQGLLILDPYCSLDSDENWQETWTVENRNTWDVEFYYGVDSATMQGPYVIAAGAELEIVNTSLGEHTLAVAWNGGKATQSSIDGLILGDCENTPYDEPPTAPYQPIIPVTGNVELEAPAAGGELLIPVTGADMNASLLADGLFKNLFTYMGLLCLGVGMVMQGMKTRLPK